MLHLIHTPHTLTIPTHPIYLPEYSPWSVYIIFQLKAASPGYTMCNTMFIAEFFVGHIVAFWNLLTMAFSYLWMSECNNKVNLNEL